MDEDSALDSDIPEEEVEEETPPPLSGDDAKVDSPAEITRRLMMAYSWSGRLPQPNDLERYENIYNGTAETLVNEIRAESELARESLVLDASATAQTFQYLHSKLELETSESEDDRRFRLEVFQQIRWLLWAPLGVLLVGLILPVGSAVKIALIVAVAIIYVAPFCIVLLKGRMTKVEADVISSVIPRVVEEVRRAVRDDISKPSQPRNIEDRPDRELSDGKPE